MKILFQTYDTFRQNGAGGIDTKLSAIFKELKRKGHSVDLFDKWNTRVADYDILHVFKATVGSLELMEYASKLKKKIVLSPTIPIIYQNRIRLNLALERLLPVHTPYGMTRRILTLSDIILTETRTETEFVSSNYKTDKTKFRELPNGIDDEITKGDPQLIRNFIPFDGEFVLQTGRIDLNKNLISTIRALKGTGIPLVVIGGPDSSSIEYYKKCQKEAGHDVFFLGWKDHGDPILASAYAAAKVLVMPSFNETFGISLIEGAASGCVTTCSDTLPVAREWDMPNPPLTFNPNSVTNMRNILIKAFRSSVSAEGTDIIRRQSSWRKVTEQLYKFYNELLSV